MSASELLRPPGFLVIGGTSPGASADAERINTEFRDFLGRFVQSATGSQRVLEPRQEIYEILERCGEDDWNREGAERITAQTAAVAAELLLTLPSYLPVPEIFPDPTGAISFEWYRRPKHRVVISIYGSGTIEFAGLLGLGNEVYGEARIGKGLPEIIESHLRHLFSS